MWNKLTAQIMKEIIFIVEESPERGFIARSLGQSIFTEADTISELRNEIRDAVKCHFEGESEMPKVIRLHISKDEILAL